MKILVTGAAGFIGSKLTYMLALRGDEVVGIDNINDYYDVRLKYGRLAECGFADRASIESGAPQQSTVFANCRFQRMDIADKAARSVHAASVVHAVEYQGDILARVDIERWNSPVALWLAWLLFHLNDAHLVVYGDDTRSL